MLAARPAVTRDLQSEGIWGDFDDSRAGAPGCIELGKTTWVRSYESAGRRDGDDEVEKRSQKAQREQRNSTRFPGPFQKRKLRRRSINARHGQTGQLEL
jgi:hypothetical protein